MTKLYSWSSLAQKNENGKITSSLCQGFVRGDVSENEVRGIAYEATKKEKTIFGRGGYSSYGNTACITTLTNKGNNYVYSRTHRSGGAAKKLR